MSRSIETADGRRIAFHQTAGKGPGVVFLGGFMSDMTGTKALHLQQWAERTGRAFLRFDYSGHGDSGGRFEDGCIGDWAADARAVIETLTDGPQVLVGSSMGGWISLLIARAMPQRVAGLVTIAAAPDFTERGFWAGMDDATRDRLMRDGVVMRPSDYDAPYPITRRLIEDGRENLVMDRALELPFPVRLLQGTADADVPMQWALDLLDHARGDDIRLTLVKGADHRFSSDACLDLTVEAIEDVLG
ncbi:alpha/beta fold hydrolase [Paracoccus zeaxanthinifaciens]|uniref:alpha/beta fold hydrolase n=1 Tax=Paracoccus zeaxanthinifaciens TaxID=187400 RepID=UPI0003B3149F|nr:alpha/beta hydrolase [Paracoccus zeaxanthinifaciens]